MWLPQWWNVRMANTEASFNVSTVVVHSHKDSVQAHSCWEQLTATRQIQLAERAPLTSLDTHFSELSVIRCSGSCNTIQDLHSHSNRLDQTWSYDWVRKWIKTFCSLAAYWLTYRSYLIIWMRHHTCFIAVATWKLETYSCTHDLNRLSPPSSLFQTKFSELYNHAQEKCYTICIPQSTTIHGTVINKDFAGDSVNLIFNAQQLWWSC